MLGRLMRGLILALVVSSLPGLAADEVSATRLRVAGATLEAVSVIDGTVVTSCSENICDMGNRRLTGTIPTEIGACVGIESLLLNVNELTGTIPSEIGLLKLLYRLDLENNQLTGTLPSALATLPIIFRLYASRNRLTGRIPPEFGSMAELYRLDLDTNRLTGPIPSEFGRLGVLNRLQLQSNLFSGTIPTELGLCASMDSLWLDKNRLSGRIPAEFGNLVELSRLYLDGNQLTGSIPTALAGRPRLTAMIMFNNSLTGPIPAEFGAATLLTELNLGMNKFSGPIPTALGGLPAMEKLHLEENRLTGRLPTELGRNAALFKTSFHKNGLTGLLPTELGNLEELTELFLNDNAFSGPVPSEFGKLGKLVALAVHGNVDVAGPIPSELGALASLTDLALQEMGLTGRVPTELGALTRLTSLRADGNRLTGPLPTELGLLAMVEDLLLGENGGGLDGPIPSELGALTRIRRLGLERNGLSGRLPSELGLLPRLTTLDVSGNALTGPLPSELSELGSSLVLMTAAGNALSGRVPEAVCDEWTDQAQPIVCDLSGNAELCGDCCAARGCDPTLRPTVAPAPEPTPKPTLEPTTGAPTLAPTRPDCVGAAQFFEGGGGGDDEGPVVVRAAFSATGAEILVDFDRPTDRSGFEELVAFPCADLLAFVDVETATCQWTASTTVAALVTDAANLKPGAAVVLRAGLVRASCDVATTAAAGVPCSCLPFAEPVSTVLLPPDPPLAVSVILTGPTTVAACAGLRVSTALSTGAGGRLFDAFLWAAELTFGGGAAADAATAEATLAAVLAAANGGPRGAEAFDVAPEALIALSRAGVATLDIRATLTNFLGAEGTSLHSAQVSPLPIPEVEISGGASHAFNVYGTATIFATAIATGCDNRTRAERTVAYRWTLSEVVVVDLAKNNNTRVAFPTGIESSSNDPRYFKVLPFTLTVGRTYEALVEATDTFLSLVTPARATITVTDGRVVTSIAGGDERTVVFGAPLELSAASSLDEDVFDLRGEAAGLTFRWTCVSGATCDVLALPGRERVDLTGLLAAGDYAFAVEAAAADGRSSVDTVRLTVVVGGDIPRVDIGLRAAFVTDGSSRIFGARVANTARIVVQAQVQASAARLAIDPSRILNSTWTLQGGDGGGGGGGESLSSSALFQEFRRTETFVSAAAVHPARPHNLVLASGALVGRTRYVLTLTATLEGAEAPAAATIRFDAALPPQGGRFAVAPPDGFALVTPFALTTIRWTSEDLPLKYAFYATTAAAVDDDDLGRRRHRRLATMVSTNNNNNNKGGQGRGPRIQILRAPLASNEVRDARLPQGAPTVTVIAVAIDALDGRAERTAAVTVGPTPEDAFDDGSAGVLLAGAAALQEADAICSIVVASGSQPRVLANATLRGELIDTLAVAVATADPEPEVLNQATVALEASLDGGGGEEEKEEEEEAPPFPRSSLTPASSQTALGLAYTIAVKSRDAGALAPSTGSGIVNAVSWIIDGGTLLVKNGTIENATLEADAALQIGGTLDATMAAAVNEAVPGEAAFRADAPNVRLAAAKLGRNDSITDRTYRPGVASNTSATLPETLGDDDAALYDFFLAELDVNPHGAPEDVVSNVVRFGLMSAANSLPLAATTNVTLTMGGFSRGVAGGGVANGTAVSKWVTCPLGGYAGDVSFECPDGLVMTAPCDPDAKGVVTHGFTCPAYVETCNAWGPSERAWVSDSCRAVRDEAAGGRTRCVCAVAPAPTDYAVTPNSALAVYARAFRGVEAKDYDASPVVFWAFVICFLTTAFCAVLGYFLDRRDAANEAAHAAASEARFAALRAAIRRGETTLARETMPKFVRGLDRPVSLFFKTLATSHSWFATLTVYKRSVSRSRRCIILLFTLLIIMFTQSFAFWLAFPPGFCAGADLRRNCEAKKSVYSELWAALSGGEPTRDVCQWIDFPLSGEDHCQLRPQSVLDFALKRLFLVFIAIVVTLPFQMMFEIYFVRYACAPVIWPAWCCSNNKKKKHVDDVVEEPRGGGGDDDDDDDDDHLEADDYHHHQGIDVDGAPLAPDAQLHVASSSLQRRTMNNEGGTKRRRQRALPLALGGGGGAPAAADGPEEEEWDEDEGGDWTDQAGFEAARVHTQADYLRSPDPTATKKQPPHRLPAKHAVGQQMMKNLLIAAPVMDVAGLAVEKYYALRALAVVMALVLKQRRALLDAIADATDPENKADLTSLLRAVEARWNMHPLPTGRIVTAEERVYVERFARTTYLDLVASLAIAAKWEARLRTVDDAFRRCAIIINLVRYEQLSRTERKVLEGQLHVEGAFDRGGPPAMLAPVTLRAKAGGLAVTALAFGGMVYFLIFVFARSYMDQEQGGRALLKAWFFSVFIFIFIAVFVVEPFTVFYLRLSVPSALYRKLKWHEDPMSGREPFVAPMLTNPHNLVARSHLDSFHDLGVRVPKKLKLPASVTKRFKKEEEGANNKEEDTFVASKKCDFRAKAVEAALIDEAAAAAAAATVHVDRKAEREANRAIRETSTNWRPASIRVARVNSQFQPPIYHAAVLFTVALVIFLDPAVRACVVKQVSVLVALSIASVQTTFPRAVQDALNKMTYILPGSVSALLAWIFVVGFIVFILSFKYAINLYDATANTLAEKDRSRQSVEERAARHHYRRSLVRVDSDSDSDTDDEFGDEFGEREPAPKPFPPQLFAVADNIRTRIRVTKQWATSSNKSLSSPAGFRAKSSRAAATEEETPSAAAASKGDNIDDDVGADMKSPPTQGGATATATTGGTSSPGDAADSRSSPEASSSASRAAPGDDDDDDDGDGAASLRAEPIDKGAVAVSLKEAVPPSSLMGDDDDDHHDDDHGDERTHKATRAGPRAAAAGDEEVEEDRALLRAATVPLTKLGPASATQEDGEEPQVDVDHHHHRRPSRIVRVDSPRKKKQQLHLQAHWVPSQAGDASAYAVDVQGGASAATSDLKDGTRTTLLDRQRNMRTSTRELYAISRSVEGSVVPDEGPGEAFVSKERGITSADLFSLTDRQRDAQKADSTAQARKRRSVVNLDSHLFSQIKGQSAKFASELRQAMVRE